MLSRDVSSDSPEDESSMVSIVPIHRPIITVRRPYIKSEVSPLSQKTLKTFIREIFQMYSQQFAGTIVIK